MKWVIESLHDWSRPLAQLIILLVVAMMPWCLGQRFSIEDWLSFIEYKPIHDMLLSYGCIAAGIPLAAVVLECFRKSNKEYVLNRAGNYYHRHTYLGYLICSKVLNYRRCRLKGVPIPMQFKLMIEDIFSEYIYNEGIGEANDDIQTVRIEEHIDSEGYTRTVNLVLIDTYYIDIGLLPSDVLNLSRITICRDPNLDTNRYHSKEFVSKTRMVVSSLPNLVDTMNIFATLNPYNCHDIVTNVFCEGSGRGKIKNVNVYYQRGEEPRHFTNCETIKL